MLRHCWAGSTGVIPRPSRKPTFGIDFQYNNDIAFHFNPRFTSNTIVRNHYVGGSWGSPEEDAPLPLIRGTPFDILFICHYDRFEVIINGAHFCDFFHRVPFHRITNLTVGQDVAIESIEFEGTP
uniref:Galectin n=1 Tax=Spodoptera frugiperda TaxID=7108 RepID=A0A2H1WC41_SPOFR